MRQRPRFDCCNYWILIISQRVSLSITLELGILTSLTYNGYVGLMVRANRFGILSHLYLSYRSGITPWLKNNCC